MPRRRIYDFCIKKDEEKINFLESEWKRRPEVSDVSSKWYQIGIMPEDEDSDPDDNPDDNGDEDDDNDSYGYDAVFYSRDQTSVQNLTP